MLFHLTLIKYHPSVKPHCCFQSSVCAEYKYGNEAFFEPTPRSLKTERDAPKQWADSTPSSPACH